MNDKRKDQNKNKENDRTSRLESTGVSRSEYAHGGRRQTLPEATIETLTRLVEAVLDPEPVERARWRETLERFSHSNSGRAVTLATRGAGEDEYRADATDTVLGRVYMGGSTPSDLSVSIMMGTDSSRHATRTITPVHKLLLLRSGKGIERGLEIVSADDLRMRLMFSGS